MISKSKIWQRITTEFKEMGRSKKMTEQIMKRIRNLDNVDHPISISQDNQRRD